MPPSFRKISLLDALKGTSRSLDAKQLDLLQIDHTTSSNDDIDLFYAGKISLLKNPCVAIVGTRAISDAGTVRTRRLARELVEAGIVVVSGLALGVDTVALSTAIEHGGDTIAVIGTPLDKAYPAENAHLQEEIYRRHLLISQFALGTKTYRSSFPQRNKLMAALSDATVVMEASDTSGTLHQAAECTRLGRWLFIAKSVVEDKSLNWPKKFLKYPTCVPLENVSQITDRILKK
jgi:DNA processing protein